MTYTPNVPQANQQIAATQVPILNNFTFLEASIGQEHNFDVTDATKTYHLQASMPNQDPSSPVPAGTNGMYYINASLPRFWDSSNKWFINMSLVKFQAFSNTISLAAGVTGNISTAGFGSISGNVAGQIIVARSDNTFATWAFFNNGAGGFANNVTQIKDTDSGHITVLWNGSNLAIKNNGSITYTFKYSGYFQDTI